MSNAARQTTTVGEIVNLMSVDTQKVQDACQELHVSIGYQIKIIMKRHPPIRQCNHDP